VEDVIVDYEVVSEKCGLKRTKCQISKSARRSNRFALCFMFLNKPPTVLVIISTITLVRSQRLTIT